MANNTETGSTIHNDAIPTVLSEGGADNDEGHCSDSDALLPPAKKPLSPDTSTTAGTNKSNPQMCRSKQAAPDMVDMGMFGEEREACSPLLLGSQCDAQIPSLTNAISPSATTDEDSATSSLVSHTPSDGRKSSHSTLTEHEIESSSTMISSLPSVLPDESSTSEASNNNRPRDRTHQGESDEFSSAISRRSPSPRTELRLRKRDTQPSPVNHNNNRSNNSEHSIHRGSSPIQQMSRITVGINPQYSSSHDHDCMDHPLSQSTSLPFRSTNQEVPGFLPLDNPPFLTSGTNSVSSAPSSQSNSSRDAHGLGNIRRFVRSRVTARTRTTAGSSSSQMSTQSLGDEDLFALTLNGDDPRLVTNSPQQIPSQRDLWDAARMQSSEHFPPIVWEESSDSEADIRERRALRTFSEPSGNRIRGFRLPRAIARAPGMRQRGSRQSSSVRRHLPRSSTSTPNMLAASPLSTTAAAVLFTSSQASQASIDSLRRSRQSQHTHRRPSSAQLRLSTASLDDSARAVGTSHRSIVMDGGGADALSISTIGNSTMARSEIAAGGGELGRQSRENSESRASAAGNGGSQEGGRDDNSAGSNDPERQARVRWIRINQRFQLMITFAAVCFSLLLFSIVISWIILTFYFIMSFQKGELCDIPLRFWYWLITLELVIDVFRNDIMRYVLQWDPAAQSPDTSQRFIPARVVAYNIAYLGYAMLVLRMGINCVYIEGQQPQSTCRETAPQLFKSSAAFVTLELAAWATIILGYLVPFCFVATLLTLNGYTPGEPEEGARVGASTIPGGVFPSAYSTNGSPPGTVERLREIDINDCDEQECCICMEDFRKRGRHNGNGAIVQTDCGHVLHKSCCSVWLRQARTCPVCRTDIPNAQAERLRLQQAELGDSSQRNQQTAQDRRQSPDHHRTAVAPHLPFRPAGRQEVATLIRAFRQPGRSRERRRSGQRRESSSQRSAASERSRRSFTDGSSNRREQSQSRHNEEPVSSIEITTISRRTLASGATHTNEGHQLGNQPARDDNTGTIDFVL